MTQKGPTMNQTVEKIARELTSQQAGAMLRAEQDGKLGRYFVRLWFANGRVLRSLQKRDLGSLVWSGLMLNDLGLAVRAHLQEQGS